MECMKKTLILVLIWGLVIATSPTGLAQEAPHAAYPPAQIEELVSPIALYPDALVAQVLARRDLSRPNRAGELMVAGQLAVERGPAHGAGGQTKARDPSIKALTQFPSVLANMAQNLSWTSALGDVFYNQQSDVMAAVQKLRKQAKDAGNLKSTPQQTVQTEAQQGQQVIVIQPANPQVVYVPAYNPTVVYGVPYSPPGYSTADLVATGLISFGVGMAVGAAVRGGGCCGWGWSYWGCSWGRGGTVVYNRNVYVSNSPIYRNGGYYGRGPRPTPYGGSYNRNVSGNTVNINRGNVNTGNINTGNRVTGGDRTANVGNGNRNQNPGSVNRPTGGTGSNAGSGANRPNSGNNAPASPGGANRPATLPAADRGYGQQPAKENGAFAGYNRGGATRAESDRGRQSLGNGGAGGGTASRGSKTGGRAGGNGPRR